MPTFPVDLLTITVVVACTTAALGGWLALAFLLRWAVPGRTWASVFHGSGALLTLVAVATGYFRSRGEPASPAIGPDFLALAFWLLAPAALLGILTLATRRRPRATRGAAMGVHACLAIFGIVVLLAYAAT